MSSSKHSGRFLIDTSLQNLNEDKRRSGNASLILQEADVKRSEIVPEEWDYLGVLGRQECQSKHYLTWLFFLHSDSQGSSRMCAFIHL